MAESAESLWAWVTRYPDGSVGQVAAYVPNLFPGLTTLAARDRDIAEKLRPIARQHSRATGQRVWLREYRDFLDHEEA